jgi:hypothetical protein
VQIAFELVAVLEVLLALEVVFFPSQLRVAATVIFLPMRAGGEAVFLAGALAIFLDRLNGHRRLVVDGRQAIREPLDPVARVRLFEMPLPHVDEIVEPVDLALEDHAAIELGADDVEKLPAIDHLKAALSRCGRARPRPS